MVKDAQELLLGFEEPRCGMGPDRGIPIAQSFGRSVASGGKVECCTVRPVLQRTTVDEGRYDPCLAARHILYRHRIGVQSTQTFGDDAPETVSDLRTAFQPALDVAERDFVRDDFLGRHGALA